MDFFLPAVVISKRELRWAFWFALFVMGLTSIPYFIGYAMENDQWVFSGFILGVEDGNSYIAKMLAGAEGAWLFRTPYTAYPQGGALTFFPYILLGKLTAEPAQHEQMVALFHLFRFGAGVGAILATYVFIALFVPAIQLRRLGVILGTLGGGLGWLLVVLGKSNWLGSLPLGFYSPETFGFLSLYSLPHLAMVRGLLLGGLAIYLGDWIWRGTEAEGEEKMKRRSVLSEKANWKYWFDFRADRWRGVVAGVIWLFMGLFQPLSVVIGWTVVGAHLIVLLGILWWNAKKGEKEAYFSHWRRVTRRATWLIFVSSPMVIYTAIAFNSDPFLREWTEQNLILSPHPLHYVVAYGLLLPFAFFGGLKLLQRDYLPGSLPVLWVNLLPFLVYAPFNLQRRLSEGVWVALVILAMNTFERDREIRGSSVEDYRSKGRKRGYRFLKYALLLLSLPSTLMLMAGGVIASTNQSEPVFRPAPEVAAFQYFDGIAEPGEVVLASFETGNGLPAWAPVRVVIGHGPESIRLERLRPRVEAFYRRETSEMVREELLKQFDVRYVFWGPAERILGDWNPKEAGYLEVLYDAEGYTILEVDSGLGSR